MKINGVRFELDSGAFVTMTATNYCILECVDGSLRIEDRIHNNGGWRLAKKYTYQQVMDMINGEDKMTRMFSVTIERTGFAQYEIAARDRDEAEALAWEKYDSADADSCVTNNIFEVEEIIPKEAV